MDLAEAELLVGVLLSDPLSRVHGAVLGWPVSGEAWIKVQSWHAAFARLGIEAEWPESDIPPTAEELAADRAADDYWMAHSAFRAEI